MLDQDLAKSVRKESNKKAERNKGSRAWFMTKFARGVLVSARRRTQRLKALKAKIESPTTTNRGRGAGTENGGAAHPTAARQPGLPQSPPAAGVPAQQLVPASGEVTTPQEPAAVQVKANAAPKQVCKQELPPTPQTPSTVAVVKKENAKRANTQEQLGVTPQVPLTPGTQSTAAETGGQDAAHSEGEADAEGSKQKRRRREKTQKEKEAHARYMRFSRSLKRR